ncbi:NnrS family protein [Catenovulum sp. SM1970]|uniref:NnrS family protein n=1 Tax=Marinifaba aquimaris TaxID=2741323 RepID=UPI001572F104|nr:NnrS family protein [Marinifaba aquimaris]NTS76764.1 NnrS family protein [Marinifaba aquimaris]
MLKIEEPKHYQSTDNQTEKAEQPLYQQAFFHLAFRSSFVLGTLSSIIALVIWLSYLNAWFVLTEIGLTPTVWHLNEMLFGFGATIAVGFILTAAQTWTGQSSITGKPLMIMVGIWLTARALFLLNLPNTVSLALVLQTIWWLVAIYHFARMVYVAQNRRNYLFIPLLTIMMLLNIAIVVCDLSGHTETALHLGRTMVLLFGILMSIVGGRVIPFFTKAGAKLTQVSHPKWLDNTILLSAIAGSTVFLLGHFITLPFTPAALMIVTGLLHLIRLSYWQSVKTTSIPLLWSLHLAYLALASGLIILGFSYLTPAILFSAALHLITIGAMGLMILAMMARVSLGHTGRVLSPKKIINLAFLLMLLAAICRSLLAITSQPQWAWTSSIVLWCLASLIFLIVYCPILFAPRKDGRL